MHIEDNMNSLANILWGIRRMINPIPLEDLCIKLTFSRNSLKQSCQMYHIDIFDTA